MDHHHPAFKVIIVHEDTIAGLQATHILKQVAANLAAQLGMEVNPWEICSHVWHFEWLQDPKLNEQAVAESATADIIIISTESETELPVSVRGWIESVLPRKQGAPMALVAFLGGRKELHAATLPCTIYLRQLAQQYGVDFICNAPDKRTGIESAVASAFSRVEEDSALLQEARPYEPSPRGWGLND